MFDELWYGLTYWECFQGRKKEKGSNAGSCHIHRLVTFPETRLEMCNPEHLDLHVKPESGHGHHLLRMNVNINLRGCAVSSAWVIGEVCSLRSRLVTCRVADLIFCAGAWHLRTNLSSRRFWRRERGSKCSRLRRRSRRPTRRGATWRSSS